VWWKTVIDGLALKLESWHSIARFVREDIDKENMSRRLRDQEQRLEALRTEVDVMRREVERMEGDV
jgi:hypothetical protein